jgi:hypothetical protein
MKAVVLLGVAAVLSAAGSVSASIAFATRPVANTIQLISFDPSNPSDAQFIGTTGVPATSPLAGLDFVGESLFAYAANATPGPGLGGLYSLSTTTGAATYIGGSNLAGYVVRDLAYNPADGQLYGLGVIPGNNTNFARIYTLNPATGLVTSQRDVWSTVGIQLTGLGITSNGTLYAVDNVQDSLYRLDVISPMIANAALIGGTAASLSGSLPRTAASWTSAA